FYDDNGHNLGFGSLLGLASYRDRCAAARRREKDCDHAIIGQFDNFRFLYWREDTFILQSESAFTYLEFAAMPERKKPTTDAHGPGFAEDSAHYKPFRKLDRDAQECAQYIAELSLELRYLARTNGLKFLAQLLEMAFQEAFVLAHRVEPTPNDLNRA